MADNEQNNNNLNDNNNHDNNNNNNNNKNNNLLLQNMSHEKFDRIQSPNKKIQIILGKDDEKALNEVQKVIDSSEFGYTVRCKKARLNDSSEQNKIRLQIITHKKSDVILQVGVDGLEDSLMINPKHEPYIYGDDETVVYGDYSSSDEDTI